jgi:hypothetical protein
MSLYVVRVALISWTGESERLVELSKKELKELEAFLEKERLENRLFGCSIQPATVRSLKDLYEMHQRDLDMEREMAEKK